MVSKLILYFSILFPLSSFSFPPPVIKPLIRIMKVKISMKICISSLDEARFKLEFEKKHNGFPSPLSVQSLQMTKLPPQFRAISEPVGHPFSCFSNSSEERW